MGWLCRDSSANHWPTNLSQCTGDGRQRRSFTWVGDIVKSMIAPIHRPEAYGEVFNVGHTKEISIYDLAVTVKRMTGSDSDIVFVPYEQAYEAGFEDMARGLPNLAKIQALILSAVLGPTRNAGEDPCLRAGAANARGLKP